MRSRWTAALTALAMLAVAPSLAVAADEVEAQLQQMQQRLQQMEDRLQATSEELDDANTRADEQAQMIERAGLLEARGDSSGLSGFLSSLELGGWVAASYFYNFDDPDGEDLSGANVGGVPAYPFHPDANSFSLDQLWFEIERPATEDHRGGFRADIVYGKTAGILSGDFGSGDGFSGNDLELYQGYVQYLAPIGEGVHLKFGKFATVIGAEVAQSPYNFNITRGNVYNLFQPITHTGILGSTDIAEGVSLSLGFVNETRSFPAADIDLNKNKAGLWSVAWSGDNMGASFNGAYGSADSGAGTNTPAGDKELILDLIFNWDPTDDISTYVNADYIDTENSTFSGSAGDTDGWGIAWGTRVALTETTGIALRTEYADLSTDPTSGGSDIDLEIFGATVTVDHKLTDHLLARAEARYDNVRSSDGTSFDFYDSVGGSMVMDEGDQVTAGVEVIYSFNPL